MAAAWEDIELITLDLDDTLVATTATIPARVEHAVGEATRLLRRTFTPDEIRTITSSALSSDPDLRLDVLLEAFGTTHADLRAQAILDAYGAPVLDLIAATPGACETVAWLLGRFKVAVITNGDSELQRAKLRRCGLESLAPTAIVSSSFGVRKPDAAIFRHACSWAGVAPGRALHVGDSPVNDTEGAIRAGMRSVLIRSDIPHPRSDVAPHATIDALAELIPLLESANPNSAIRNPQSEIARFAL